MPWKSACHAGTMTKRVLFKSPPATTDSFGEPSTTWTDVKTVWASVEPLSGREFLQAQASQSEVTHKIIIRASGITANMRAVYDGRTFEIASVMNQREQGAIYVIMAKEVV